MDKEHHGSHPTHLQRIHHLSDSNRVNKRLLGLLVPTQVHLHLTLEWIVLFTIVTSNLDDQSKFMKTNLFLRLFAYDYRNFVCIRRVC